MTMSIISLHVKEVFLVSVVQPISKVCFGKNDNLFVILTIFYVSLSLWFSSLNSRRCNRTVFEQVTGNTK